MKLLLSIFLFTNSCFLAQIPDSIRNKKVTIYDNTAKTVEEMKTVFPAFLGKELDSIDISLLNEPSFMGIIISKKTSANGLTYGYIYNELLAIKQLDSYPTIRNTLIGKRFMETTIARSEYWEKDKKYFLELGASEQDLEKFHAYLLERYDSTTTYQKHMTRFEAIQQNSLNIQKNELKKILNNSKPLQLEQLLKKSQEANKPLLLYFTCWACISSRKWENELFSSQEAMNLVKNNFIFVPVYVDDRGNISDELKHFSPLLNKDILTIGDFNFELEKMLFKKEVQPYFVILNPKGETITSSTYEEIKTTNNLIIWLDNGLK